MSGARWWQTGIVYQVYPRSFMDTDGDGVGDLNGVRERLAHLEWLGVDALWLSPIFVSPMADFGYDVADYRDVDPLFGTLADFDRLLADAHSRGLKVILDFVPNHTSERHPWFLDSRSSRDAAKRDWYLWRDPAPDGGPPNNWRSAFGGSAWEWDAATGQYYYHAFLKEQPDLNWRNPDVRRAMHDVLRFWLERGVDGFRVDVIWHLIKDAAFPDNPPNPEYRPGAQDSHRYLPLHSTDQPEVHEVIAELRRVVDAYDDRVLIGEIYLPVERLVAYYGEGLSGVHLPFNFQLIHARWDARHLAELVREYERLLPPGGWPNWVLSNHDQPRIAARVGEAQARNAALLLLTLRGTPTLYYGDELGLGRVPIPPDRVQDPWERNEPGLGVGRDPSRTPMQWDESPGAGFTRATPWLPFSDDRRTRNVAAMRADPRSLLWLHRELVALRRAHPALAIGEYVPVEAGADVLAYERRHAGRRVLVLLNLSHEPRGIDVAPSAARVLLSTRLDRTGPLGDAPELRADEGLVVELPAAAGP